MLEKMHMYGDEDEGEPKGDDVNYTLMIATNFEPSCYEKGYINGV